MVFKSRSITLKDGRTATLRRIEVSDAAASIIFMKTVTAETHYLLRTPEECDFPVEQEEAWIQAANRSEEILTILCEADGCIIGDCRIVFKERKRERHRCEVMIRLLKDHWGNGIGTAMFRELIAIAQSRPGITQMELEVMEDNIRAIGLYHKMGFRIAATLPGAIRLADGTTRALHTMIRPV